MFNLILGLFACALTLFTNACGYVSVHISKAVVEPDNVLVGLQHQVPAYNDASGPCAAYTGLMYISAVSRGQTSTVTMCSNMSLSHYIHICTVAFLL